MPQAISNKTQTQQRNGIIKYLMIFVGVSGCFSVLFGAWLAHAGLSLPVNVQLTLKTALQYQLLHTLALLIVLVWATTRLSTNSSCKLLFAVCIAFAIGILCFSVSIYIKTFFSITIIGKLTPIGGISLAVAWLLLSIEGKRNL